MEQKCSFVPRRLHRRPNPAETRGSGTSLQLSENRPAHDTAKRRLDKHEKRQIVEQPVQCDRIVLQCHRMAEAQGVSLYQEKSQRHHFKYCLHILHRSLSHTETSDPSVIRLVVTHLQRQTLYPPRWLQPPHPECMQSLITTPPFISPYLILSYIDL